MHAAHLADAADYRVTLWRETVGGWGLGQDVLRRNS
jgi:hypothetical protein